MYMVLPLVSKEKTQTKCAGLRRLSTDCLVLISLLERDLIDFPKF